MKKNKIMSPLIIVGILISTALADISHVLSGTAHPPANPVEVNSLDAAKNGFQSGNPNDFWWMATNSPLKEAYEYFKKCSNKGDCLPPVNVVPGLNVGEAHFDPIDLKKNPFINGNYQRGGGASSSSFSISSSGCSSCSGGSKSGEVAAFHTGTKIDITNNPFLGSKYATAGNGELIRDENGFLGVQPKKPAFATSHPLTNKKPFATSPPNVPQSFVLGGDAQAEECKGSGYICVRKHLCVDGVVSKSQEFRQIKNDVQYCNVNTEVCCRLTNNIVLPNISGKTSLPSTINGLADVTAGKSSVTGSSYKFSGSAGSSPGQIQVLTDQYDDVKPQVYNNGESGSHHTASSNKTTRDVTLSGNFGFPGTIDYSGVEFPSDVRFASTIRGPAYLPPLGGPTPPSSTPDLIAPSQPTIITYQPSIITTPRPIQTTRNTCPPGTILTPSGLCETLSTPIPPCPFGTIRTPDGNCEAAVISTTPRPCPPGTILTALGSCEAPRTPTPACPYGTILTPDGSCARPVPLPLPSPSPTPACPFGTIQKLDGTCERLSISTTIRPSPSPSPRPCPAGTFLTATGICEAPRSTLSCPIGTIRAIDGTCLSAVTPTTPLPCPPGTILTAIGTCESAITPTPRPSCPPGTIQTPSGICEQPIVSSTTVGYPSPCPPGTFRTLTGLCERLIATTARPECPPGTYLTPLGICETPLRPSTPKPPPRPFQTTVSRDYLPPVTPTQPSLPPSSGYYYETPTPTFGYPSSTLIPNSNVINNQYVLPPTTPKYLPPPPPDRYSEGSRIKDTIRLPDRRPTTERPDNNVESVNNINVLVPSTRLPFIPELNNEPPVGCAAALKCVQEIYCTAEGVVSPVPVVLTKDQELLRVPTTECRDIETGIIGKCCRDPNYKDPWPSANLVNGVDDGQYKENNFYGQQNILGTNRLVRASNSTRPITRGSRNVPKNSKPSQPSQSCGERNKNTQPEGPGPIDANFAEYPWQAMILRDSNRSLLCGGAIIRRNAVLTTAHCLEGLETSDVLIKGGEWKLGIDEEPLPFQIVKVGVILRHPEYVPGSYKNDLAVLVLRENLRPAKNVGPICLPSGTDQAPKSNCVATGWGKRILQLHAKGAIMHHTNVNVMDSRECQQTLEQNFPGFVQDNYGSSTFCGKADIDHCKVDYGSALACADSQGHYTLAGIYTWDTGCKSENQIGGYIAPDVNWIESTLAKSIKELKMIERQYLLKTSV